MHSNCGPREIYSGSGGGMALPLAVSGSQNASTKSFTGCSAYNRKIDPQVAHSCGGKISCWTVTPKASRRTWSNQT